jgi:hypothetical protein
MFRYGCVLAVVAVLCVGLRPPALRLAADEPKPEEPKPAAPAEADFTGKVVAISADSPDKFGVVLEKVQVRKVGERSFLVGKGVDDGREGNYYKGRTVWVAVDRVVFMVQFASVDELKKSYEPGNGGGGR